MPRGELRAIPEEAHFLAWDDRLRRVVAYDRRKQFIGVVAPSIHTKRQSGTSCSLVDQGTLARMEGYKLIEQSAANEWGADWDRMLTNDPDFPNNAASVCVSGDPPNVPLDAPSECSSSQISTTGVLVDGSGKVTLSYKRGTSTEMVATVTQAALFPIGGVDVTAPVNMPVLTTNLESISAEMTIKNQITQTSTVTKDSFRDTSVAASAPAGQTCHLELTNTTCTGSGKSRIRMSAIGWVWVNYPEPRKGHYKWAISIEGTIPDIEQRSSYIEFGARAKSYGVTNAAAKCALLDANGVPKNGNDQQNGQPGESSNSVSPVLVGVPVALGVIAVILAIVAFFVWRRRRAQRAYSGTGTLRSDGASSHAPTMSTHPGVTPVFFPQSTSLPPESSYTPSHVRGPSMDQSVVYSIGSSSQPGDSGIGGPVPMPVMEKGRPVVSHASRPSQGSVSQIMSPSGQSSSSYSTFHNGDTLLSPGRLAPAPPAYTESPTPPSSTAGTRR